jgi:hypothetical protein
VPGNALDVGIVAEDLVIFLAPLAGLGGARFSRQKPLLLTIVASLARLAFVCWLFEEN